MLISFLSVSTTPSPELAEEVAAIIKHSISDVLPVVFRSTSEALLFFSGGGGLISLQTPNSYTQNNLR